MKIVKIKIQNLNSLKGEFEIDFESDYFRNSGLFAITGKTGAGKTTILDAITLALFNKTPRNPDKTNFTTNKIEEYGFFITKGTNTASAEVIYEVNGIKYRSFWRISRKRTGKLHNYEMSLVRLSDGKIIEAEHPKNVPAENEKILGLNYEQFVKSVILAQGEFAKFLKAQPNERLELLGKITGQNIYEQIGRKIFERAKNEELKLQQLIEKQQNIEILSPEQIDEIKQQIEKIKAENAKIDTELNNINLKIEKAKQIIDLQKNTDLLKQDLTVITQKIAEKKHDFDKLELYEKLLPVGKEISLFKRLNEEKNKIEQEINLLKENISAKQQEIEKINNLLTDRGKKIDNLKATLKNLEPKFSEEEKLTITLSETEAVLKQLRTDLETKNNSLKLLLSSLKKLRTEYDQRKQEYKKISQWLEKNQKIEQAVKEYEKIKNDIRNYQENLQNLENLWKQLEIKIPFTNKPEILFEKVRNEKQKLSSEYNKILSLLPEQTESADILKEKKATLERQKEILIKFLEKSKIYLRNKQQIEKNEQTKLFVNQEIIEISQKLQNAKNELEIQNKNLEKLQKEYELELLKAKYEKDRMFLSEGEPCPLCGSTHHPYVKIKPQIQKNIVETEIEKTKKIIEDLQKIITNNEKQIAQKRAVLTEIEKTNKNILLQNQEFEKIFFETFSDKKIEELNEFPQELERLEAQLKKLSETIQLIEHKQIISTNLKNLQLLSEKIKDLLQKKEVIIKYWQEYAKLIGAKDLSRFLDLLKTKIEEYNRYKQEKEQVDKNLIKLNSQIAEKETAAQELSEEIKKLSERINSKSLHLRELYSEVKALREKYFEGLTSKDFRQKLTENIENEVSIYNNEKIKLSELRTSLTSLDANLDKQHRKKQEITNELQNLEQIVKERLLELGITSGIETVSKQLIDEQTVEKIKSEKEALFGKKEELENLLRDKISQLEKLRPQNEPIDLQGLIKTAENLKNVKDQNNRQIGIYQEKLAQNQKNLQQYEAINKEIEKQTDVTNNWKELNKLIGDKEGKKFMRIAQVYTMRELISVANAYLEKLNDRYVLEFSDAWEENLNSRKEYLKVVDKYLAWQKRSVQTLSGGESFLVSLSLALGLSDIASKNTAIESLFIDEGFGTLDEQALERALNILENLQQMTNKTIGIISHIPAVKERIQTQIEVIPDQETGFSRITFK